MDNIEIKEIYPHKGYIYILPSKQPLLDLYNHCSSQNNFMLFFKKKKIK